MKRSDGLSMMCRNTLTMLTFCLFGASDGCLFPAGVRRADAGVWVGKAGLLSDQEELRLIFKENRMFVFKEHSAPSPGVEPDRVPVYNRTCANAVSGTKFIASHEEEGKRPSYLCMEIVMRSKGMFQLKSSRLSRHIEPLLCYKADLSLDPWLFVSLRLLREHHQISSFSGGYNMKIHSAQGDAYGCNSMELPMRLESECIGGDGVNFRFRYETCKENLPMEVDQRTYCVADWIDGRYSYSILRKMGHDDLWCLRAPLIRGKNFTATLFLDAMCRSEDRLDSGLNFVSLNLEMIESDELCQDEYAGCSEVRCTPYTERTCQKSCGLCHSRRNTVACKFPKFYRGEWLQNDFASEQRIKIGSSKIAIQNVGTFKCVQGGRPTQGVDRKYALLSVFPNGCRPRFTCVAFRRLGHSVISYTLSQSITWPFPPRTNIPEAACEDSSFAMDPGPIRDAVRGNLDTFKTIVSAKKFNRPVKCKIQQALAIQGSFNGSTSCSGKLFEDCNDPTRIRIELNDCASRPSVVDFQCLSIYEGRYWENITILQNVEQPRDARCLVLSAVRPGQMLMMASSECDKQTWVWASGAERTSLGKFRYRHEGISCKIFPPKPTQSRHDLQQVTYKIVPNPHRDSAGSPTRQHRTGFKAVPVSSVEVPPSESLPKDSSVRVDNASVGSGSSKNRGSVMKTFSVNGISLTLFCYVTVVFPVTLGR